MVNTAKTVVVLGGGVGGVVAATILRKELPDHHRVIIVDRERDHLFAPSLLWLMTGGRTARQISRPLDRLAKKGIEVVRGDIERIDPTARIVRIRQQTTDGPHRHQIEGDHIVISLGAALAPEAVPGPEAIPAPEVPEKSND